MPAAPTIRPMREADAAAVHAATVDVFDDYSRRRRTPLDARVDPAMARIRYSHLVRTDPEGAWIAEDERGVAGAALALWREGLWGLSLLVVRPDLQSAGLGRALLERAHAYAEGARGRVILASADPRALRAYSRLGLTLHPCAAAKGTPRGVAAPADVRAGTEADIPFTEEVDRIARGAAHGADIGVFLALGARLLVAPGRGYAVVRDDGLRLLAGVDDAGAADVLRAVLAQAAGEMSVDCMTADQGWAVEVCVEAGLELDLGGSAIFLDGDVGPFRPYLPSGAFL
jgi:GNAT superfamily N-acetyltransferase